MAGRPRVQAERLERFIARLLETYGVGAEDAAVAAEVLVAADLNGVDSHGTARLTFYLHKLEAGLINPRPRLRVVAESPIGAVIDGDNGLGQGVSRFAMDYCIRRLEGSALAPGAERIYIHGEPEFEAAEVRRHQGIPLDPAVAEYLRSVAAERGLEGPLG